DSRCPPTEQDMAVARTILVLILIQVSLGMAGPFPAAPNSPGLSGHRSAPPPVFPYSLRLREQIAQQIRLSRQSLALSFPAICAASPCPDGRGSFATPPLFGTVLLSLLARLQL